LDQLRDHRAQAPLSSPGDLVHHGCALMLRGRAFDGVKSESFESPIPLHNGAAVNTEGDTETVTLGL
jgi:hypothetical protein